MKKLLLFLFSLLFFSLGAQNYRLFDTETKKAFVSSSTPYWCYSLSFDSVTTENSDSVYYNFFTIRNLNFVSENCNFWLGDSCFKQNVPVWFGKKALVNGYHYSFINIWDDTLFMDFSPNPFDTICFYKNDTSRFDMIYAGTDTLTVLNTLDSVRFFNVIRTVNGSGQHIIDILVGKNTGLISFFKIDLFPLEVRPLYLVGRTNPDAGMTKMTNETVFQYHPGDILEYYEYSHSQYGQPEDNYARYKIYTVLNRRETTDTLIYRMEQVTYFEDSSVLKVDTITKKYLKNKIIAELPFEYFNGNHKRIYLKDYNGRKHWTYKTEYDFTLTYCSLDDVWGYTDTNGPPDELREIYVDSVGYFSYYYTNNSMDESYIQKSIDLIYYKISGYEYGNPMFLGLNNTSTNTAFVKIYPNPAVHKIAVESDDEILHITLLNLSGKQVLSMSAHSKTVSIDISGLLQGIYLVDVLLENGRRYTGKIKINR